MLRKLLLSCLLACPLVASAKEATDLDTRTSRFSIRYIVNADGTYVEQRETAVKVLTERVVPSVKQTSVTYSTSIQKAEVVEAYTMKPDGRRIDVPNNNYQYEINKGHDKSSPVYSDRTTLTVVFPEVAVGDTLVWHYRLIATEPLFPGHFSEMLSFSRYKAFDDVSIGIDTPLSMWVQYKAHHLAEVEKSEKDGRRVITWKWSNPKPEKFNPYDYGIYEPEKEPTIFFTTFRNYAEIAEAYGSRARPIAAVTPRVKTLADEIARDAKNPKEAARLLYEWVARNISYAGNCIGLGAVVPRDMDFILNNRMGDCKDHATLYQALLAAKGIRSTQALINSGSTYTLPAVPVVEMVNHVINYLPDFDLYADPTSDSIPFGMLPFNDADKPVLWVDGYRDNTKTPSLPVGVNRQNVKTIVRIADDGSAKIDVKTSLAGMFAVSARERFRNTPKSEDADIIDNMLKGMRREGSGRFTRGESEALVDHFEYRAEYEAKDMFVTGGPGAFYISPMFYSDAPVSGFIADVNRDDSSNRPFPCTSGLSVEEYEYHLPKNMKILAVPDNVKLSSPHFTYAATYRLKGNVLYAKRTADDRTVGHVCSAESVKTFKPVAKKVMNDLRVQIVYK